MKLYTEEQIKRTFGFGMNEIMFDGFLRAMTPIELPSDEEIENLDTFLISDVDSFIRGAKWMRDKILQGGNK